MCDFWDSAEANLLRNKAAAALPPLLEAAIVRGSDYSTSPSVNGRGSAVAGDYFQVARLLGDIRLFSWTPVWFDLDLRLLFQATLWRAPRVRTYIWLKTYSTDCTGVGTRTDASEIHSLGT